MRFVKFLLVLTGLALGLATWAHGGQAGSSVRLACNDFPPHKIEHPGADGLLGFDVDIVSEAMKRIGLATEVAYMPWKRALEMTGRGDYDGLCSCSYARDREDKLLFSDELGAVSVGLFARSHDQLAGVTSAADLKGRKVATVGGYNLEAELNMVGAQVEATSSDKAALDMLVGGNVDLLYGYELTTKHFIASDPRSTSIVYQELRRNPYHFCLSRAMPGANAVMQGFDHSLSEMAKDGTIKQILAKYHVEFR